MRSVFAFISYFSFIATLAASAAETLKLSSDVDVTIIVAEEATPAERHAAEELSTYLGKIRGKSASVTVLPSSEGSLKDNFPIIVGWHELNEVYEPELLGEEETLITITPESIHILGGRSLEADENGNPLHDRGTLYGVYDFLEMLGVRWYRPEPWGEHVPELEVLELPLGEIRNEPAFKYRYGIAHYNTTRGPQSPEWLEKHFMAKVWAIRNRQNTNIWSQRNIPGQDVTPYGGSYGVDFSHAYFRLIPQEQYYAKHPEYFALINGQRSSNRLAQLCLGNPDVQDLVFEKIYALAKSRPNQEIFSLDPNDTDLWCECELCVAMDEPATKAPYGKGAGGVSMSNRVMRFNNIIAKRLAEVMPGKSVGSYAYWQYTEPPSEEVVMEPNVVVSPAAFASTYSDYSRKLDDPKSAQNKRFLKVLEGYYERGLRLFAREYWSYYIWPGPMPTISTMADRLTNYHSRFGMEGVYSQADPCWGPQGMLLYFYTWLLRNPYADVEAEKDLYYRNFYGPANEPMKRYHEKWDEVGQGRGYWGSGGNRVDELLNERLMRELDGYIEEARKLVEGHYPYDLRFAGVEAGHRFSRLSLDFQNSIKKEDFVTASRRLKEMEELYYAFPDGSVFSSQTTKADGSLRYPGIIVNYRKQLGLNGLLESIFIDPKVAAELGEGWLFLTDPEGMGVNGGWAEVGYDDGAWSSVVAGKSWQESGHPDFRGMGWYRRKLTLPEVAEGRRMFLFMEDVGGGAQVYVNGSLIHATDENRGIQDPVYVDITDAVNRTGENLLCIAVDDNTQRSGLTGQVLLLDADSLVPPE